MIIYALSLPHFILQSWFHLLLLTIYLLVVTSLFYAFFFSSRRRHTRFDCDWSSDVCSSDLEAVDPFGPIGMVDRVFLHRPGMLSMWGAIGTMLNSPRKLKTVLRRVRETWVRSEERRVGEEWRSRWAPDH